MSNKIKYKTQPNPFVLNAIKTQNTSQPTIEPIIGETYSQCYEDILISSRIRAIELRRGEKLDLMFVEIGANHPIACSSTLYLEKYHKMNGILVEANPALIPELIKQRPKATIINAAITNTDEKEVTLYISSLTEISSLNKEYVETWGDSKLKEEIIVPAMRIDDILAQCIKYIILFIDIEGLDLQILKDMSFKYRPFIIQAEAPTDEIRKEMGDFMQSHNYELFGMTDVNLLFANKG
jgi:FkbM family methyltransferase